MHFLFAKLLCLYVFGHFFVVNLALLCAFLFGIIHISLDSDFSYYRHHIATSNCEKHAYNHFPFSSRITRVRICQRVRTSYGSIKKKRIKKTNCTHQFETAIFVLVPTILTSHSTSSTKPIHISNGIKAIQ